MVIQKIREKEKTYFPESQHVPGGKAELAGPEAGPGAPSRPLEAGPSPRQLEEAAPEAPETKAEPVADTLPKSLLQTKARGALGKLEKSFL